MGRFSSPSSGSKPVRLDGRGHQCCSGICSRRVTGGKKVPALYQWGGKGKCNEGIAKTKRAKRTAVLAQLHRADLLTGGGNSEFEAGDLRYCQDHCGGGGG